MFFKRLPPRRGRGGGGDNLRPAIGGDGRRKAGGLLRRRWRNDWPLTQEEGREMPFTNQNILLWFVLSNFYFHASTIYNLLRKIGAPLGKMDFPASTKTG